MGFTFTLIHIFIMQRHIINTWDQAGKAYIAGDMEKALDLFYTIDQFSKIKFNIGMIHMQSKEHRYAVMYFDQAIQRDAYFAVAYFQKGCAEYQLENYSKALVLFSETLQLLGKNNSINYAQLGLKFELYRWTVLINVARCYIATKDNQMAQNSMEFAVIAGYRSDIQKLSLDSIKLLAVGASKIFRISPEKANNAVKRDYMSDFKVLTDCSGRTFHGFSGALSIYPALNDLESKKICSNAKPFSTLQRIQPCLPVVQEGFPPLSTMTRMPRRTHARNNSEPNCQISRRHTPSRKSSLPSSDIHLLFNMQLDASDIIKRDTPIIIKQDKQEMGKSNSDLDDSESGLELVNPSQSVSICCHPNPVSERRSTSKESNSELRSNNERKLLNEQDADWLHFKRLSKYWDNGSTKSFSKAI